MLPFIGIAFIFLFMSISFIIASWYDFYQWENAEKFIELYKIYSISLLASFTFSFFIAEYVLKKTRYIGTGFLVVGMIVMLFQNNSEDLNFYSTIFLGPVYLLGPIMYYIVFIRPSSGILRQRMLISILGFFFIAVGIGLRHPLFREWLDTYIYSIGTLVAIVGCCFIGYGFAAFSTFTDLKWKEKLRELFVIYPGGVCLYAFSFEQKIRLEDSDLIAGGFSGIQSFLSEIVKTTESLHLIDYQDLKIMIEQGPNALFILIIKEESSFLQYKLKQFANEFQTLYKNILVHWDGEINIFKPTSGLIQTIFEIDT